MSAQFYTREFEMSHGRSPKGRGSWGFIPVYMHQGVEISPEIKENTAVFVIGSMTLTESKKAIKAMYPEVAGWEVAP
jgi:hypothetical protein